MSLGSILASKESSQLSPKEPSQRQKGMRYEKILVPKVVQVKRKFEDGLVLDFKGDTA